VKNPGYKLEAGPPVSVRFFVKYNAASTVPSVKSVKLNGKTVCTANREETVSTTPRLHISQIRPNRPNNKPTGRPSGGGDEGAYLHNREPPSQQRPSNNYNNNEGSSQRPNNYNNQQSSNHGGNRRPSGSSQSNSINNSHRESQTTQSSGTNSNGLSAEEETPHNESDFFPGDFAVHRPSQSRPPSRPSSVSKRNVACGTVAMKASPLISYGQNTTQGALQIDENLRCR
jgi:hypothetical protein